MTLKEKALSIIDGRIKDFQGTLFACEDSMKKDFARFFVSNADVAYKASRMISILNDSKKWLVEAPDEEARGRLEAERDFYLNQLVNNNVIQNTTNMLYNLSHCFEMQMYQDLYKFFSLILRSGMKNKNLV